MHLGFLRASTVSVNTREQMAEYRNQAEITDEELEETDEEHGRERARRLATLRKRRQREKEKIGSRPKRVETQEQRCTLDVVCTD